MTPLEASQSRKRRDQQHAEQRAADLKALLHEPAGQRFFYALLDRDCGVFSGSAVRADASGPIDPLATIFNEGRRSVGIDLMLELQRVAPLQYQAMVLEAIRTQNYDAATKSAETVPGSREAAPR